MKVEPTAANPQEMDVEGAEATITQDPTFVRVRNGYEPAPPTHGFLAAISAILFFPVGIPAFVFAFRSSMVFRMNKDRGLAEKYSKMALVLSWLAIGCFVVVVVSVSIAVTLKAAKKASGAAT